MSFATKAVAAWIIAALSVGAIAVTRGEDERRPPQPAAAEESPSPTPAADADANEDKVLAAGAQPRWKTKTCALPPELLRRSLRGYFPVRSPDLSFVPRAPHFFGDFRKTTTHSGPWDYVQEVPLVLYGPGFIRARGPVTLEREVTVADLAPTFARLLGQPFPARRPSKPLTAALVPKQDRPGRPRLIMTVVWDGGGWNTLNEWPRTWPNLARTIANGTSFEDAIVGSSPSVTPAIHANLGVGAFPNEHGIVSIPQRRNGRIEDAWKGHSPHNLRLTTFADIYDRAHGNRPKVGLLAEQDWHLGMIGHGAYLKGADKDVAVLTRKSPFTTNHDYYRMPRYINRIPGFQADVETVDRSDGKNNGKWLGHRLPASKAEGFANPAWTLYQVRLLKALLNREGFGNDRVPDLFFTNFKQIDEVSHAYFLQSPEMKATIPYSDDALGAIIRWLDREVGERRWVLAMTADHGVGPRFTDVGAWPIDMDELLRDVAIRFGQSVTDLFQIQRPNGFWLQRATLRRAGVTRDDIANFLLNYTIRDNKAADTKVPEGYGYRAMMDDKLFAAAWPSARIRSMSDCAEVSG